MKVEVLPSSAFSWLSVRSRPWLLLYAVCFVLAVFIIECFELLSSRLMRSRLALSRQVS
jgi:hypothetical protein